MSWEQSMFNARPHPGLLPRGEGEPFAVSYENLRLSWSSGHCAISRWTNAVPSPWGEGQGEGGRSQLSINVQNQILML
jgi:hypothetical protein